MWSLTFLRQVWAQLPIRRTFLEAVVFRLHIVSRTVCFYVHFDHHLVVIGFSITQTLNGSIRKHHPRFSTQIFILLRLKFIFTKLHFAFWNSCFHTIFFSMKIEFTRKHVWVHCFVYFIQKSDQPKERIHGSFNKCGKQSCSKSREREKQSCSWYNFCWYVIHTIFNTLCRIHQPLH